MDAARQKLAPESDFKICNGVFPASSSISFIEKNTIAAAVPVLLFPSMNGWFCTMWKSSHLEHVAVKIPSAQPCCWHGQCRLQQTEIADACMAAIPFKPAGMDNAAGRQ